MKVITKSDAEKQIREFFRFNFYLAIGFCLFTLIPFQVKGQEIKKHKMKNKIVLEYSDGSSNHWTIMEDSIFYKAVVQEESSSGMYSGGQNCKKGISKSDFLEIEKEFDQIRNEDALHITNRIMTSGMLTWKKKNKTIHSVIIKNCSEMQKLELTLKRIIE